MGFHKVQGNVIKPTTVYSFIVLIVCLAGCDAWLLVRLRHEDTLVASLQYDNDALSHAPVPGQLVPLVQGIALNTKQPRAVKLEASHRMVLLVFSQNCKFCQDNWNNWERLFGNVTPKVQTYMITSDSVLSTEYLEHHALLKKLDVLLSVDPEVLQAFNVASTPQTIYIIDGKVQRDWVGVLSKRNITDLSKLLLH